MRRLVPGDEPQIEHFLAARPASSMFLRSNLRAGGLLFEGRPYQGTWVGAFDADGLLGVVAHAWTGNLILQAPDTAAALARAALAESGRALKGLVGPWSQVVEARAAVGLPSRPGTANREDLFDLDLHDLVIPDPIDGLAWRVAGQRDVDVLTDWRCEARAQAEGSVPGPALAAETRAHIERNVGEGAMFVIEDRGLLVACSTFNARLPDCVQIGGVWTPPMFRGRGYARRVVAGSLVEARSWGVARSILFTGEHNEPARRAYLALGYRIIGDYGLVLW